MGFDKCIMSYIHHYSFIQNNVTMLEKNPLCFTYPIPNPSSQIPGNHRSFYHHKIFTFPRTSYNHNYIVCSFFRLTSFTEQYAFKIHLECFSVAIEMTTWFFLISVCYCVELHQLIFKCQTKLAFLG